MDIRTERLNSAFRESGLSQTELCHKTGINKGALSSYLSGHYFPKQQALEKLSSALNVSVYYLMGLDEPVGDNRIDSLFIKKYGQDSFDLVAKYQILDQEARIRINERVDMLLEDDKYKRGSSEEKAI